MVIVPILLAVFGGLVFGFLRRGRVASISLARIRYPVLLALAVAASLFVDLTDAGPSGQIALLGLVFGLVFTILNAHLVGMAVISIGVMANLAPVALNGAMPVRPEALVEAEMVTTEELPRVSLNGARELETDDTMLGFLGDTFPIRWTNQVVSLGDLVMLVGLADVVANLMLRRRRRRLPPSAISSLEAFDWGESIDLTETEADIDLRVPAGWGVAAQDDDEPAPSSTASPVHD